MRGIRHWRWHVAPRNDRDGWKADMQLPGDEPGKRPFARSKLLGSFTPHLLPSDEAIADPESRSPLSSALAAERTTASRGMWAVRNWAINRKNLVFKRGGRIHGGKSPGVPAGERNGNCEHGGDSGKALQLRRVTSRLLWWLIRIKSRSRGKIMKSGFYAGCFVRDP
jgi:hypothetical protein